MPFKFIKNIIKQSNLDITELDDEYRQLKMKNIRKSRQVGDSIKQKTKELKKNSKIKNKKKNNNKKEKQIKNKNIKKTRKERNSIQQKTNEIKKNRKIKNRAFETIHKK